MDKEHTRTALAEDDNSVETRHQRAHEYLAKKDAEDGSVEVEPVAWQFIDLGTGKRHVQLLRPNVSNEQPLYRVPPDAAAQIATLEAACDSVCYARDQAYVQIDTLTLKLEVAKSALEKIVRELGAVSMPMAVKALEQIR